MQNKPKAELTAALMLLDTRSMSFDMREIDNRRFMFSPQTGELILGRQYRGGQLCFRLVLHGLRLLSSLQRVWDTSQQTRSPFCA